MCKLSAIKRILAQAGLSLALLLPAGQSGRAEMKVTEAEAKAAATLKPLPEYPPMARQLKITGKVELDVTIDPAGSVKQVDVASGNPVLSKACAKVVNSWKFTPFQEDGKPATAVARLTFEFR